MGFFDKAKQIMGMAKSHSNEIDKAVDTGQEKFTRNNPGLNKKIDSAQLKFDEYSKKK